MNEYQYTNITDNSDILVFVGSNITLQCTCNNDTIQWHYSETNSSSEILTLVSVEQSNSDEYTCIGQIQNVPYSINVTVYSKSLNFPNSIYYHITNISLL